MCSTGIIEWTRSCESKGGATSEFLEVWKEVDKASKGLWGELQVAEIQLGHMLLQCFEVATRDLSEAITRSQMLLNKLLCEAIGKFSRCLACCCFLALLVSIRNEAYKGSHGH